MARSKTFTAPGDLFPADLNALQDWIDARVALMEGAQIPLGMPLPYGSATLPAGGRFDWADGGLIDRTTYLSFFTAVGHVYNGNVDPGSNKVRKPDYRGRTSVGADAMPTSAISGAAGAAGRIPNSNRAVGQNGGEERHTQTVNELVSHAHTVRTFSNQIGGGQQLVPASLNNDTPFDVAGGTQGVQNSGGGQAFNVMQPYGVDYWIVRIA